MSASCLACSCCLDFNACLLARGEVMERWATFVG
jgi:hypothetical protein